MDRREFLARAGTAAAWAAVSITIMSCSDDDGPTTPGTGNGVTGSVGVSAGHSHSGARVTDAQLQAGDAVQLTLTGSGHTHTVMLTAQQVADIGAGQQVTVQSSDDQGHMHTVTFN
jgi:hypothetical protein